MRKIKDNIDASAIPLILFIFGVFVAGAFYTLLFVIVGIPSLSPLIPDSMFKTFILGIIFYSPFIILVVGIVALVLEGIKRSPNWRYNV